MIAIIKFYACYTVKIYKNKPQINFKKGGALGAPVLDPPLDITNIQFKRLIQLLLYNHVQKS